MQVAWLLLKNSGKSNWRRLGLTAGAVTLGMLMLLVFAGAINGLNARQTHSTWRRDILLASTKQAPINGVAPLKVLMGSPGNLNKWHNESISLLSVRASGDNSPSIPGMPTPKEGEYYVSRGLDAVIREHPDEAISSRFGTRQIGIIPESLSTSPDSLEVVRGMSAKEAEGTQVLSMYKFTQSKDAGNIYDGVVSAMMAVGATILLLPIVVFISIATQLGGAQREQRYAALRLIGATKRQVRTVMALEAGFAAVAGIMLGTLIYLALLPLMSNVQFGGMRFYQSDLTVPVQMYSLLALLTLGFCLFANWIGVRRAQVSPLGVVRSAQNRKQPRAWRLILLVPGILLFAWTSTPTGAKWLRENSSNDSFIPATIFLALGVMGVMFGLLLAGPWLTSTFARLFAGRSGHATTLLASKRIETQSKRIFRSVSGVVLALFAGSFYLVSVSGIAEFSADAVDNNGYSQLRDDTALIIGETLPSDFANQLREQSYIQSVMPATAAGDATVFDCATLRDYTRLTCPVGGKSSDHTVVNFNGEIPKTMTIANEIPATTGTSYLVKLDNAKLDQLRSFVARKTGIDTETWVVSGTYAQQPIINPMVTELANLAYAGMFVTLAIAILSLIVSTIGGLLERKRSFATLRLGGMTVRQMKRVVLVESLIPLIVVSLVACGLGVWIGFVFISAFSDTIHPTLTPLYIGIVGGSLVVATLAIISVVPMLDRLTRPEENRTE